MAATGHLWWETVAGEVDAKTRLTEDEPLAPKTTFRVGGPARFYAEPATVADLRLLWRSARAAGIEVFLLGRGSNLIVADSGFPGLVIRLQHPFWRSIEVRESAIEARAGLRLKQLCGAAANAGLKGFEFLEGIPGSLGGALRMNAGAMGSWTFDVVEAVEWMTTEGEIHRWEKARFHTDYRQCRELVNGVALGATLRASGGIQREETEAIRARLDFYAKLRKSSQPREPSAGCIFKNPPGNFAGKLIDELGLKGTTEGGASVSVVHGNFIINRDAATCAEVIALIRELRARVRAERGIELEPEVFLLGAKWEEVLA